MSRPKKKKIQYSRGCGKDHPNWKGGRLIAWNGYVRILMRDHPRALSNGYVWEHIVVVEKKIKRPLAYFGKGDIRNETVHHINGIKTDNRPRNLEVLSMSDHARIEWAENEHKYPQSKKSQIETPKRYNEWLMKSKNNLSKSRAK